MRRSFGGGGSGSMGGGNGGSGMLRTIQRSLRAGVGGGAPPEPFSHNTTPKSRKSQHFNKKQQPATRNTALTLSSSSSTQNNGNSNINNGPSPFSSLISLPVSGGAGACTGAPAWGTTCSSPARSDDVEWECVEGMNEDERVVDCFYDDFHVFGTVPSRDEVNCAISTLQQVLEPSSSTRFWKEKLVEDSGKNEEDGDSGTEGFEKTISSSDSDADWVEPSLNLCNSRMLQSHGSDRVYDAFHLLRSEPSVQRMVLSLSSDKAVWDAVLNNEVVKELRGSMTPVDEQEDSTDKDSNDSNSVKDILSWVFVKAKAGIMQLINKIAKLLSEVFQAEEKKAGMVDTLEDKLKTALFLSVVVLLIVVVTRAQSGRS